MATFTDEELAACAEREVTMRRSVYPRWVRLGRLKQDQADREIAVMAAIVERLRPSLFSERPKASEATEWR
jgi:hypothetical protein